MDFALPPAFERFPRHRAKAEAACRTALADPDVVGMAVTGSFAAGSLDGWLPNGSLQDPRAAQIQLVLNDHGPKLQGFMPGMIQTYRTGCTDASIPGIFPPSARADGTPGPNTCQLYQMAAFPGS